MFNNIGRVRRGVAVGLLIVVCGLFTFAIFHTRQLGACLFALRLRWGNPGLAMVPRALVDESVDARAGIVFSRFGYSFEIPWTDVDRVDDDPKVTRIVFKSRRVLLFFDPKRVTPLEILRQVATEHRRDVRVVFGAGATESNYSLLNSILKVTPSQFSVFMPANDAVRNRTFLRWKQGEALLFLAETGLFFFRTPTLRGFQMGDPSRNGGRARIVAFDGQDREYEFWVLVDKGANATVTQADINKIIQTLHSATERE